MSVATFDSVNRQARPYPSFLLPKSGTALALFAAGFLGWNDCIHLVRADLQCDFVDSDKERLFEMATIYPGGHVFHVDDAWKFAENAVAAGRQWDVVTLDPWVPLMGSVLNDLPLWCKLAKKMVTVGCPLEYPQPIPKGWRAYTFPRNERVGWLVLQR